MVVVNDGVQPWPQQHTRQADAGGLQFLVGQFVEDNPVLAEPEPLGAGTDRQAAARWSRRSAPPVTQARDAVDARLGARHPPPGLTRAGSCPSAPAARRRRSAQDSHTRQNWAPIRTVSRARRLRFTSCCPRPPQRPYSQAGGRSARPVSGMSCAMGGGGGSTVRSRFSSRTSARYSALDWPVCGCTWLSSSWKIVLAWSQRRARRSGGQCSCGRNLLVSFHSARADAEMAIAAACAHGDNLARVIALMPWRCRTSPAARTISVRDAG